MCEHFSLHPVDFLASATCVCFVYQNIPKALENDLILFSLEVIIRCLP